MIILHIKDYGDIQLELDHQSAPITCQNFEELVKSGFYDGLTFHRIIKGFMIQGGWGDLKGKHLDYSIKGEFASNGVKNPLLHKRGVLSMARTMFPDSASSQFFIMHKDAPHLDGEYAAFGHLTSGFDVLDKIASVRTGRNDMPVQPVEIESIEAIDEPTKPVEKIR